MTTHLARSGATPLRRLLTASVLPIVVASALAGCGANFNAQTNRVYQAAEGTNDRSGGVYSLNTLVVSDGEGNGTVVARLVNQQPDEDHLTAYRVLTRDGEEITTAPLAAPIAIAAAPSPDQSIQLATDGQLRLTGDNFEPGDFVTLQFQFDLAAPLSLQIPVVPVGTEYVDVPIEPIETPSDTPQSTETTG